jgi:signal transduction histidine kinase
VGAHHRLEGRDERLMFGWVHERGMMEPISDRPGTERVEQAVEASSRPQVRFGLRAKIILFGAGVLIPLAALTWFISVESLRRNMTQEFTSKGVSIAQSLANSAVDPILTRDASTDQALVDQYVGNSGVAYVLVYDAHNAIIAHTFVPRVPPALIEQHRAAGTQSQQVREMRYADPATGTERQIIDVAVPMLAGRLGVVHVGMDQAIIAAAATRAGNSLLLVFAAIAALSTAAAALFARRLARPLTRLMDAATRVGRGDLSELVPTTSRDEVGLLTATFNDTVVRLRSLVQTEAERDHLKKLATDLTEALEQQTATSEILRVISQSQRDVQPVFETIAANARKLCGASSGWVFTFDGESIHWAAADGPDLDIDALRRFYPRTLTRDSATTQAILTGAVADIPDVRQYPEYGMHDLAAKGGFRSVVAVPMRREERTIGTISVTGAEPAMFTDRQIAMLQTFADQAVIAIENTRLFNELQARTAELGRSVEELKALGEVGNAVSSTLDLDTVLTTIISRANQLSGAEGGLIYEYDEVSEELHLRAAQNFEVELVNSLRVRRLRKGEGVGGRVVETRAPFQVPDITAEGAYQVHIRDILIRAGYRALLAVPLVREQQVIGAFLVGRKHPGDFPRETIELLTTFASQSALAIQNARLFRALEDKSQQLELASRHKSQFLAGMSHELRTPLNAILGYTELIADRIYGEVPEKIGEVLERVQRSGRHLLGLINDVLDLSKIEAGQLVLTLSEYSFNDILQAVAGAVGSLATEKQLRLRVDSAEDLPVGQGDQRRITQVLLNLVGNAIKFTDAGEVAVRVVNSGGEFLVSVADSGPGIAQEDQQRIFEEFQQGGSSLTKTKGGTGLGLAIAKRIVEMHGGRIWVQSTPGKGSTFFFSLPVRAEQRASTA